MLDIAGVLFHLDALTFLVAEGEVAQGPVLAKNNTRMGNSHGNTGDGDHGTFENHECHLIIGELAVKSTSQFGTTEDGTGVDSDESDDECWRLI